MEIGQDKAALINQKSRPETPRGDWLIKEITPNRCARNINRRQPGGFVNIDIILFFRRETCAMNRGRLRPMGSTAQQRRCQLSHAPVRARSQPDKPECQGQSKEKNAEFHACFVSASAFKSR